MPCHILSLDFWVGMGCVSIIFRCCGTLSTPFSPFPPASAQMCLFLGSAQHICIPSITRPGLLGEDRKYSSHPLILVLFKTWLVVTEPRATERIFFFKD